MDFSNTNEAEGGEMILPGFKGIFTITEVKSATNTNNKHYFAVTFTHPEGNFRHSFYTSAGARPRLQHLWKKANGGQPLDGNNVTEQQIIAGLRDKRVGLKVGGRIGDNGKTYPDLAFGGFACPPVEADVERLVFSAREQRDIDAALANMETQSVNGADTEVAPEGSTEGTPAPSADDF